MKKRTAEKNRETKETNIKLKLAIDGSGKSSINTGIGFLDHMLELFAFHGLFDLEITATGDLKVDIHHTNEDIGIVLGDAFKEALGDKKGIKRISSAAVPMEDVVANVTADISGRGSLKLERPGDSRPQADDKEGYALNDAEHFFEAFAKRLGVNLNITIYPLGKDLHTTLEPVFKALGLAMDAATQIDPRRTGIPSTKGIID
ncbi:MAG: imidazoleglycerol-phosphate dehydratase [Candidatus Omnitrophica bacterium]|nr:imidazoleglycerol-phosphate dehydratase [Candidatus Omnitrophota bacterium]